MPRFKKQTPDILDSTIAALRQAKIDKRNTDALLIRLIRSHKVTPRLVIEYEDLLIPALADLHRRLVRQEIR